MEFDLRIGGPSLDDWLDMIRAMRDYASANYTAWGHWAIETWSSTEYVEMLREANWNLETAQEMMRQRCLLWQEDAQGY